MSDVEVFYLKLQQTNQFPNKRPWHTLDPMQQMQFVHGINIILQVMHQI